MLHSSENAFLLKIASSFVGDCTMFLPPCFGGVGASLGFLPSSQSHILIQATILFSMNVVRCLWCSAALRYPPLTVSVCLAFHADCSIPQGSGEDIKKDSKTKSRLVMNLLSHMSAAFVSQAIPHGTRPVPCMLHSVGLSPLSAYGILSYRP